LDGLEPQQLVSPEPGKPDMDDPEKEAGLDIIFFSLLLPHDVHLGSSFEPVIRISLCFPQSSH